MTLGRRLVAALLAVVVLSGCSLIGLDEGAGDPTGDVSASAPTADLSAFYRQAVSWSGCGKRFRCAKVKVPLDYSDPDRGQIELAVIRRPAKASKRIGTLMVNPGGPGASGVNYARSASFVVTPAVLEAYDIVGFDPRGVGGSAPVECVSDGQLDALFTADSTPDDQAETDALAAVSAEMGAGCRQNSPQLAPYLDSVSVARDMDVIRAVLGDDTVNFLAKSYATLLGALYAELFPHQAGRLVLDGVLPSSLNGEQISHDQAVAFDTMLRRFVAWCIDDDGCPLPADVDQGVARIQQLLDGLDAHPLPGIGDRPLTEALGTSSVINSLYSPPADWVMLEYGLAQAFDGDGSVLLEMLDDRTDRNADGTYLGNFNEAFYAVSCLDRPGLGGTDHTRELAAAWAVDAPTFGAPMAWGMLPCWQWPFTPVQVAGTNPTGPTSVHAHGAGPILVVSTRYDPATPYEWGVRVAGELDSGHLLTYEGDGHTAYFGGSDCVDKAVDAYLLRGELPVYNASCPAIPVPHQEE